MGLVRGFYGRKRAFATRRVTAASFTGLLGGPAFVFTVSLPVLKIQQIARRLMLREDNRSSR